MKVLDTEIDLDDNKYLIFSASYKSFLILAIITAIFDALSTTYFMNKIGLDNEYNMYVKYLSLAYGFAVGPFLGKIYQLFAIWVFSMFTPGLTKLIFSFVIISNSLAFVLNMSI